MKPTAFEASALGVATYKTVDLTRDAETGELKDVVREYTLVLDMNAQAKVSELLNKNILGLGDEWVWDKLTPEEVTTILHCSMARFHPEVTLEEARRVVPPVDLWKVHNILVELCFPGILKRIADANAAKAAETAPNPPSATS